MAFSDPQKQAAWGAIGGALPIFLGLIEKIGTQESILIGWEALGGYVAQMLGMALVGLAAVVASRGTEMIKSLLLGASAPALLSLAAPAVHNAAPAPPEESRQQQAPAPASSNRLVVFSMGNTRAASQSIRKLTVETNFPVVDNGEIHVIDPQTGHEEIVRKNLDGSWSVSTDSVRMIYRGALSGAVPAPVESDPIEVIPGNDPIVLRVTIQQTFLGGFLSGLRLDELGLRHIRTDAEPRSAR